MMTTMPTTPNVLRQTLPLLTAEEERGLGLRIRDGDRDAFDRLVLSNIRLVTHYVGRLQWPGGMQRADVEQHGMLGLMEAARRYDPEKYPTGRFSTYAVWWIRNTIHRAFRAEGAPVRVPSYLFNAAKLMRMGRDVPESIKGLVAKYQAIVVLNVGNGDGLIDDIAASPEGASVTEDGEALAVALSGLPARERAVIEGRFYRCETLDVVGRRLGITKERVRQIEDRALRRLRNSMVARELAVQREE